MNPNVKLIIIIRDPTTRAISQFAHFLTTRNKVEYNPNKYDSISKYFEDIILNNQTGKVNNHSFITAGMYVNHYK
jgi:hypothetical protein